MIIKKFKLFELYRNKDVNVKNLTELEIGDEGVISELSDLSNIYIERGIVVGEKIRLVRKASGETFCIYVSDIHLCIRKDDASHIAVEL